MVALALQILMQRKGVFTCYPVQDRYGRIGCSSRTGRTLVQKIDNLISSCHQARQLDNVYLDAHVHVSARQSVTSRSLGRRARADKFYVPLSVPRMRCTAHYHSTNTNFSSVYRGGAHNKHSHIY